VYAGPLQEPTATSTPEPTATPTDEPVDDSSAYYVAPDGSDSNPGTEAKPWRTIQKAADTLSAGETVIVKSGVYNERVYINNSGTSSQPIKFRAESLAAGLVNQDGTLNGTTVKTKGFTINGDYVSVRGFEAYNPDYSWSHGSGFNVEGNHVTIEDNYAHYCLLGGVQIHGSNALIKNNKLYRNGMVGIRVHGRNSLIENNEIWETIENHPNWLSSNGGPYSSYPSWLDADGIRFFGSGHVFRGNYIHDIYYRSPGFSFPDDLVDDAHVDCFQTWTDGEVGHDILFDSNYCDLMTYQNNNEKGHGFMLNDAYNLVMQNNIMHVHTGVNTWGGGNRNLTFVNNTWVGDLSIDGWHIGIGLSGVSDIVIKNNIFVDYTEHPVVVSSSDGLIVDNNLFYRSDGYYPSGYFHNYPIGPNDIVGINPRFVDFSGRDYHLQSTSPAIDAGANVGINNDYDGHSRPHSAGYDIGADEVEN
jgi:hypothetical protein